jgi:hypothetical protein
MKGGWTAGLSAVLALWAAGVGAEEFQWRPAPSQPLAPAVPAATLGRPIASLGRPVPLTPPGSAGAVAPVAYTTAASPGPVVRAQAPDTGPPAVPPPGVPAIPGGEGLVQGGVAEPGPPVGPGFWGRTGEIFGFGTVSGGRALFQSDHCFDNLISPVTNPSEFEDPRSLTELRPEFIYQHTGNKNPIFHGGDIEFLGLQARVALTDRLSVVMDKLGWIWMEPHSPIDGFVPHSGFAEIDIGPKFTFYRCEQTGTIAAAGLTFEIPAGDHKVFQDTGDVTLRPYISFAQTFGRTSYGSFDFMTTLGYNFGVDNARTDNFFSSWHVDFNIANANKIYPLVELNWRHYTMNGKTTPIGFEGGDLFNFGAEHVAGHDVVTIGPGVRYKFTEWAQIGTAVEFSLTGRKDIEDFRWTVDMIFRY